MEQLLNEIASCTICAEHLPLGPRPVVRAHPESRVAIIGQAPGTKVHASGIPWDDASGRLLRTWLDVSDDQFYDERLFAIVPMGFCYPGKGKSGDLPPRKECAPQWHDRLWKQMPKLKFSLLIGQYAQKAYLAGEKKKNLTQTVREFHSYLDRGFFPLPHPSPRNRLWLRRNPWFDEEIVPELRRQIRILIPEL